MSPGALFTTMPLAQSEKCRGFGGGARCSTHIENACQKWHRHPADAAWAGSPCHTEPASHTPLETHAIAADGATDQDSGLRPGVGTPNAIHRVWEPFSASEPPAVGGAVHPFGRAIRSSIMLEAPKRQTSPARPPRTCLRLHAGSRRNRWGKPHPTFFPRRGRPGSIFSPSFVSFGYSASGERGRSPYEEGRDHSARVASVHGFCFPLVGRWGYNGVVDKENPGRHGSYGASRQGVHAHRVARGHRDHRAAHGDHDPHAEHGPQTGAGHRLHVVSEAMGPVLSALCPGVRRQAPVFIGGTLKTTY